MPPKILYFDLGKVLLEFSHDRMCRQMAEVAGVSWEAVRDAILGDAVTGKALIRYESGQMSTDEFFQHVSHAIGATPDRVLLAAAAQDIFEPIEPMWDLCRRLHSAGNRLAILSNTNPLQWEFISDGRYPLVAPGRAGSAFDWAILSYEVGAMKPDATIYTAAMERAGAEAHEMFFTDDRLENVEGAQAVGIDAVLFTDARVLERELAARGVAGAAS